MTTLTKTFAVLFTAAALTFSPHTFAQGSKGDKDKKKNGNSSSSEGGQSGYQTGIGLRGGFEGGITIKHFIKSNKAIEGIVSRGWGYGGIRITGLYEIHKPFPEVKGLDWFYGLGAHVGFYNGSYYGYYGYAGGGYYDKKGKWHATGYRDNYTVAGIDGILGLEYQFEEIPFTIGIDLKPSFDFIGRANHFGDGAFSIRYTIK
ncbi:MAG: hypothetical protein HY841_00005 [Bacteroidetes bacterium]|nr:hypothetical protein [Bacteroidota bacterium]